MKKKHNLFRQAMAVLLAGALLSGCSSASDTDTASEAASGTEVSSASESVQESAAAETAEGGEMTTLSFVLYGSAGEDAERIWGKINEKLAEDLNVQVELVWLGSTDPASQMSLMLSSGEPMDLIYTASWFGYKDYAAKNAYAELTEEELQQYAPQSWAAVSDTEWLQSQINGKTYTIPWRSSETTNDRMVMIRGDLREKYGLEPLETWDDLIVYLDAALADEDENFTGSGGMEGWISHLLRDKYGWAIYDTGTGLWYDLNEVNSGHYEIFSIMQTDEYLDLCKTMRSYYEKGYWPADAVANSASATAAENITQFDSGLVPMISMNEGTTLTTKKTFMQSHPDWNVEVYGLNDTSLSSLRPSSQGGTAVSYNSPNKELCLQVIDLLRNDQEYHNLLFYGEEGVDWEAVGDDSYHALSTLDFGCNWGLKNADIDLQDADAPEDVTAISKRWVESGRIITDPLAAFTFDRTGYETEMAQLANVYTEYYYPLYYGMYEDVDGKVEEFRNALDAAGLQTVLEAINGQIAEFATENGLN